jgi:hypothetical protein
MVELVYGVGFENQSIIKYTVGSNPTLSKTYILTFFVGSLMVKRMTVNHFIVGSSPIQGDSLFFILLFFFFEKMTEWFIVLHC